MKKILITLFLVLSFLLGSFFVHPKTVDAQSPANCGYLNESCCNFVGSPNSCKAGVGLQCVGGTCVPDGTISNPPTRGGVADDAVDVALTCDDGKGIQTAIGCIRALSDQNTFLSDILKWAVGVGSGIAFLLMLYAGFMIMTASGNPERIKAGQELLTSAIAGLILLVFSVFILRFIGVDILGLDAFGFNK